MTTTTKGQTMIHNADHAFVLGMIDDRRNHIRDLGVPTTHFLVRHGYALRELIADGTLVTVNATTRTGIAMTYVRRAS